MVIRGPHAVTALVDGPPRAFARAAEGGLLALPAPAAGRVVAGSALTDTLRCRRSRTTPCRCASRGCAGSSSRRVFRPTRSVPVVRATCPTAGRWCGHRRR